MQILCVGGLRQISSLLPIQCIFALCTNVTSTSNVGEQDEQTVPEHLNLTTERRKASGRRFVGSAAAACAALQPTKKLRQANFASVAAKLIVDRSANSFLDFALLVLPYLYMLWVSTR